LPDFLAKENFIARLYEESLCTYRESLSQLPGNLHNAHLEPKISVVLPLVMWRQTVTMLLHLVQTDYVGSVTQDDAAGATHLVTNTPPGPSTQQTSIFQAVKGLQHVSLKIKPTIFTAKHHLLSLKKSK
jgi:hypothetical protein